MEAFFYAVIAICGALMAIRMLVFIAGVCRSERPESVGSSTSGQRPAKAPETASQQPVQTSVSLSSDSSETSKPNGRVLRSRAALIFSSAFLGRGLTGKLMIIFTAIIAAFGLLTMTTVYFALASSLRRHASERANVMAVNISDSVPAYIFKKDISSLRGLLRKYASREGVAYVLVENRAGKILAHSFGVLPQELKPESPHAFDSVEKRRAAMLGQGSVYEVSAPVLDERVGAVRLGVWRGDVDAEISRTLMPLIKLLSFITGAAILLAIFLVWKINRPILKLIRAAKSISIGDLDTAALDTEDPTEFGELSRALERMRSSVKAAMIRLSQ